MTLSVDLIEKSTAYSLDKLNDINLTDCPDLFLLQDFLHPQLVKKLIEFLSTSEINWQKEIYQEYKNRLKIHFIPDTVIEELHIILKNLTDTINIKFRKKNRFLALTIWQDQQGFIVEKHDRDNEIIDLSLQIYLSESTDDLGTKFQYHDKIIQANYKINHGYLYDNVRGVTHYMDNPVPKNHIRYSLYAMWSRIT